MIKSNVDDDWEAFMRLHSQDRTFAFVGMMARPPTPTPTPLIDNVVFNDDVVIAAPKCDALNISTKTKALFLNQEVDIQRVFWDIPVIPYWRPDWGVVKKQMKIVSNTPEELDTYLQRLPGLAYYREQIIKQINLVNVRRTKFKDERKISIGMSQKDILNARGKKKNAFYNCFALIIRTLYEGQFREVHVKIFNTGKMEIPGILHADLLTNIKTQLLALLRPCMAEAEEGSSRPLDFVDNQECDGVLINSNFNCGFHVNRDVLYEILRSEKYGLEAAYDACSYPGIKCKFYFNNERADPVSQRGTLDPEDCVLKLSELGKLKIKYTEVSFMIFRTGSVLIVGNCSEAVLTFVYDFLKRLFTEEYARICIDNLDDEAREKKIKPRRRTVDMTSEYFHDL
jgi:hypothetical protein